MRVFRFKKRDSGELGRFHQSWLGSLLAPLSVRERIMYGMIVFVALVATIGPRVIANDSRLGKIFSTPALQCTSDGWENPERAEGHASQNNSDTLHAGNSAHLTEFSGGSLVCGNFIDNDDARLQPSILLAFRTATGGESIAGSDNQELDPNQTEPAQLESRPEPVEANAYGTDATQNIDGVALVSVSADSGVTWQPLHYLEAASNEEESSIRSILLPDFYNGDIEQLAVKIDSAVDSNTETSLLVGGVSIGYEVGQKTDIKLDPIDASGNVLADEQPALTGEDQLSFELKAKDPDDGFWQGLGTQAVSLVSDQAEPDVNIESKLVHSTKGTIRDIEQEITWENYDISNSATWNVGVDMPAAAPPGAYSLIMDVTNEDGVTQQIQQNFLWGVLALNTDKSIYKAGETAAVHMTALNERGQTLCGANLSLTVTHPGGKKEAYATFADTITQNESCEAYGPHITPDYETSFTVDRTGEYKLELFASTDNGNHTIVDVIQVEEQPTVSLARRGPTRVYPPSTYPVWIDVTATEDFRGVISEFVPADFRVEAGLFGEKFSNTQAQDDKLRIDWEVDLKANQPTTLTYTFQGPPVSPEFYLLGPATMTSDENIFFEESRNWQIASDAVGDIAIYREATGTEAITTTLSDQAWDTTVTEDAGFSIDGSRTLVDLADGGHYFVTYNLAIDDSGGTNRSEVQGLIDVAGTDSAYGRSTCFVRRQNGTNECWLAGSAIIDASAGDDLKIESQRTDSNTATVQRRANESGLSLIKLNDTWDYALIREAGGGQTFNSTTFAAVTWDTNDELDSGSFSRSGADITLNSTGHYLVTANVMFQNSSGTARRNNEIRLTLDGTEIEGTRTSAYIRGNNSTQDHAAVYSGIINAAAGDVLNLEAACEGEACGGITNVGGQTAISIAKIPNSASYVRLHESGGGQAVDGTDDPITWDTQDEVDSDFSHSTGTNPSRITVQTADDYLFLGSFYANRNPTTSTVRHYPHWEWRTNGTTTAQFGSFGKFNRGDNGSTGTFSSGNSGAIVLDGLSANDYVELINTDESTSADANDDFRADLYAVQGVGLTSLFDTSPSTDQLHFRWRDDSTDLNTSGGFLAAEDSNAIGNREKGDILRLRMEVANAGQSTEAAARQYELEFGDASGGSCSAISTWTGVADTANDAFDMYATTHIDPDGEATTTGLLANTESHTYINGEGREAADVTGSIGPLAAGEYTELEFSFEVNYEALTGHTYCFRLYDAAAGSPLDEYSVFPQIAIDSQAAGFGAFGEAGTFTSAVDGGWTNVSFTNTYTTPVVVGTSNSHNGQNALVFEARNVTSTSADMRVCESEGSTSNGCDTHAAETVGYLVVDASVVDDVDGLEAGTFTTSGEDDTTNVTTNYSESFSTTPLVFANVNTVASSEVPIEVVINSTTTTNFNAGICDHLQGSNDSCDSAHGTETVGWVAIEPGNEPFASGVHQNGTQSVSNSAWTAITFSPAYSSAPALIAASQTDTGGQDVEIDEARLVTTTGADIRYCEIDATDTCDGHSADTVAWGSFEQTDFKDSSIGQVNLDLDTYRFYRNTDAIQPVSTLAAEDTEATDVADGDVIRIRAGIQAGDDLAVDTAEFTLQYGAGATCSAIATWNDVGGIGSAEIWRGFDNATPTDGADITARLLSTTDINASYVEENNAPENPNAIDEGERGEWDFVVENNGAASGTHYCFRVVTADDQTIHYRRYPALTTALKPREQKHFRWRDDSTDLNTSGGWLAAEDNNSIGDQPKLETIRLRIEVANNDPVADSISRSYELQHGNLGSNSDCSAVTTWTAIDTDSTFNMADSTHIDPNGEATTTGLLANTESYTYQNGEGRDQDDATGNIGPLGATSYTEIEFAFQPGRDAVTGHTYCFRAYDATSAAPLDSYLVYPQLTLDQSSITSALGEFNTVSVSGTTWSTVNMTNSYTSPIIVASPRYAQTAATVPERSVRVRNKTATSFQVKVDNHDNTVTGSTTVDYVVFEEGDYTLTTAGGSVQLVAGTHNTSNMVVCAGGFSGTGGDLINFPITFDTAPIVLNTLVSDSDTAWVTSHVHGTGQTSNPTTTQMRLGLDRSFESCTHGAEDIDYIAMEEIHDTISGEEFESDLSDDNVAGGFPATGYSNTFSTAFGSTPQVAVVDMQRVDGANGGDTLLHTGGAPLSTTNYFPSVEELGTGADRGHATEPVGILAFESASGTIDGDTFSLDQDSYRWYENTDGTEPSTGLAAENTPITDVADAEIIRIRLGIQAGLGDLGVDKEDFKLQFSSTASTCDAASGWTDVGALASGVIWRGYDNSTPADGATVTSSLINGGSNEFESYTEENDTALVPNEVVDGDRGEWDFAVENNGAAYNTTYCFRVTLSDSTVLNYTNYPELTTAPPSSMILLYDGVSIPTDWTCISCSGGDDVYQRFIRGESTYGTTGGNATHNHTANGSVALTGDAAIGELRAGVAEISQNTHTTTFTPTIDNSSNLPAYRQLQVIQYDFNGAPSTIPSGAIGLFDAAVPTGFTRYSAQDGDFTRGENTIGTTGGSNTHANPISGTTDASGGPDTRRRPAGAQVNVAQDAHTHDGSGTSTTVDHQPPYIEVILGQANSDIAVPANIITMWNDAPSGEWDCVSCQSGDALYQRFFKAAATYGTTGGNATHTHGSVTYDSGPPIETWTTRNNTQNDASDTHVHSITVDTYSTDNHLPPYIEAIFYKYTPNNAPNDPSGLDQIRVVPATSIAVGDWTNDTQVRFDAVVSDPDNPDSLQLCVEVKLTSAAFTNTEDACGSAVAYSGTALTATVTIAGLSTDSDYHWQARVKDAADAYSNWVSFGGNGDTPTAGTDFAIDTTVPTGTVYDGGVAAVDADLNAGELDELEANWVIDSSVSGLSLYEYSIGTTPGATDIVSWTSNGTSTSVTATSLNLNTSQPYYFNVRTTDNADNQSVISSDGLFVAPTLSFSTSPGDVTFDPLNAGNSYSDTETATLTTSTNAYNGYVIRAFLDGLLTSPATDTISSFDGGTYAAPDEWLSGDRGYGYTSNDNDIQGANLFNPVTCLGGGSSPCYAPFDLVPPGDIVADHTALVTGTPVTNENFIITHRVTVDDDQPPGTYQTTVVYTVTATY